MYLDHRLMLKKSFVLTTSHLSWIRRQETSFTMPNLAPKSLMVGVDWKVSSSTRIQQS